MPSIHYFQNSDNIKNGFSWKPVLFGIIFALIVSAVLIFAASFILLYTNLPQKIIPLLSRIIMFVSALSGGIVSGIKSNLTGWLYGAITGTAFFCLLFLLGIIFGADVQFTYIFPILCVACAIAGCIGGVLGINLKPKRKNRSKH